MHPAPIIITDESELPQDARYEKTLDSGERIYRTLTGAIYALQPKKGV